jgi:hypothetical protein
MSQMNERAEKTEMAAFYLQSTINVRHAPLAPIPENLVPEIPEQKESDHKCYDEDDDDNTSEDDADDGVPVPV